MIERSFHLDTIPERDEWMTAYKECKAQLEGRTVSSVDRDDRHRALSFAAGRRPTAIKLGIDDFDMLKVNRCHISTRRISCAVAATECGVVWCGVVWSGVLTQSMPQQVLGKGTFGKVMLARKKDDKAVFAIKVLKKSMVLEKDELVHTLTENNVLAKCQHPFLTRLFYSFQTEDLLCFVLEYVNGGELFFHLSKDKRFSEDRTRFYIAEIGLAMT